MFRFEDLRGKQPVNSLGREGALGTKQRSATLRRSRVFYRKHQQFVPTFLATRVVNKLFF